MRFYAETDDGKTIEIGELAEATPESGTLILMCNARLKFEDEETLRMRVTLATGKPCIVLGPHITKVLGI